MPAMGDQSYPVGAPRVDVGVVALDGALNAAAATELLEALQRQLPHGNRVVLDLGGVTRADSAGLGALVRALKAARDADGDLVLARLQPEVARLMNEIGLDQLLSIFSDLSEARAHLEKS
jgi:anti-sigma B factor antagonist